jgi:phosphoglycerate kinase
LRVPTLIWNGPLGAFEIEPFNAATNAAARGGGAADPRGQADFGRGRRRYGGGAEQGGAAADFTFISTAGGAFLEWMEGKELPGVQALMG